MLQKFDYNKIIKVMLAFVFIFLFLIILNLKIKNNLLINNLNLIQQNILNYKNSNKKQISLNAEKYLIYNLDSKKNIISEKSEIISPLASVSKVITVATFLKAFKENNLNINDDKYKNAKSKIQKALIQSDNEDAEALGDIYRQIFGKDLLADCNLFIQSLGITNYKFQNLTGLDFGEGKNLSVSNQMSSNDLTKIFQYIYDNEKQIFEWTKFNSLKTENNEVAINTNSNVESTYGLLISKTGFTDLAQGNLATIINYAPGQTFLIIIFQSTKEGRFTDLQRVISVLSNL